MIGLMFVHLKDVVKHINKKAILRPIYLHTQGINQINVNIVVNVLHKRAILKFMCENIQEKGRINVNIVKKISKHQHNEIFIKRRTI